MENKLSIIIPIYNEEKTIKKIINQLLSIDFICEVEVILVNDGSKDNTISEIQKIDLSGKNFKIIDLKENGGKGAALKAGFKKATGDIIAIQDADCEYNPNDINKLVEELIKEDLEIVYGSRLLNKKNDFILINKIANILLSKLSSLFLWLNISDVETCYKVFRKKYVQDINISANDFVFEIEFTFKALRILKDRRKFKEVPINYYPRTKSEGKKIKFEDGVKALYYIIKFGVTK